MEVICATNFSLVLLAELLKKINFTGHYGDTAGPGELPVGNASVFIEEIIEILYVQ